MSEPLPEKPHKSLGKHPRSIWSFYGHGFWKAFKKSLEKYGWAILICGLVYSFGIPFIPAHIREEKLWGFDMNYWLTYAIPGTLLLLFLAYHLFRAPYEIYLETFEKTRKEIEEKETEIETLKIEIQKNKEQPKPLEIEPFSTVAVLSPNPSFDQRVLAVKNNIADCTFEIHNRNPTHAIGDVELRLLKIEPPMESTAILTRQQILGRITGVKSNKQSFETTDRCDLSSLKFPIANTTINGKQWRRVRIFTAERRGQDIKVKFDCQSVNGARNEFTPNGEHILTIEVAATGMQTKTAQFKLLFFANPQQIPDEDSPPSTKSKEPIFSMEKIGPFAEKEAAIIEMESQIQSLTEKLNDALDNKAKIAKLEVDREVSKTVLASCLNNLQGRVNEVKKIGRYSYNDEIKKQEEKKTIDMVNEIIRLLTNHTDPVIAAFFTTSKPVPIGDPEHWDTFSMQEHDWLSHINFLEAYINSMRTIIERQIQSP